MKHNENGSVTFEIGDQVGDTTTGSERFGQVKALKGDLLVVESNQSAGVTWEVEEKLCFPD
ncbi:hypothetical protein TX23_01075 [Pseudomonas paralactis]|uniref:Uncharacterized protein n=1 Tax=Pseudomonas paralactis TaxID=1615673 RepID=A0A0R3ANH6_9PSED|nr:hypothetical protein [Pseudomonas paralactis]KRP74815.1 hypothetical protein TX23_01075 [Pseudomonas paralactis]